MSGSRTVPACPPIPGTGWLADYYSFLSPSAAEEFRKGGPHLCPAAAISPAEDVRK